MDILDLTAISLICSSCGGRYQVPLKQVLLSQDMLRHWHRYPWAYLVRRRRPTRQATGALSS
jgi:hypothetical protein